MIWTKIACQADRNLCLIVHLPSRRLPRSSSCQIRVWCTCHRFQLPEVWHCRSLGFSGSWGYFGHWWCYHVLFDCWRCHMTCYKTILKFWTLWSRWSCSCSWAASGHLGARPAVEVGLGRARIAMAWSNLWSRHRWTSTQRLVVHAEPWRLGLPIYTYSTMPHRSMALASALARLPVLDLSRWPPSCCLVSLLSPLDHLGLSHALQAICSYHSVIICNRHYLARHW